MSYPDRENFGRQKILIDNRQLINSLDNQYRLLPSGRIKFHGALYHESAHNLELVPLIIEWLLEKQVTVLIAPPASLLAKQAPLQQISVWNEGFIERGYHEVNGRIDLIPRGNFGAELVTLAAALEQFEQLNSGFLQLGGEQIPFEVQTACIHSDSPIALQLAQTIHRLT